MHISVNLMSGTADTVDSVKQTIDRFADAMASIGQGYPPFRGLAKLAFGLSISHPIRGAPGKLPFGKYHTPTNTFYASAALDYAAWIEPNWSIRVDALAESLRQAAKAVHKTRITPHERAMLLEAIDLSAANAKAEPPAVLAELQPIYLVYNGEENARPDISFGPPTLRVPSAGRIVEVLPSQAMILPALDVKDSTAAPEVFKLYRRRGGEIEYREGWIAGDLVIEHWGRCGEPGEIRRHSVSDAGELRRMLGELKAAAKLQGFRTIPPSRHATVVVERSIEGFGAPTDLKFRHALEDFLDERLGWLGLGHCDGGSIGTGSMEVYCRVVDLKTAVVAIRRELAGSPFGAWVVRELR
jgi:hypothetical protein